MGKKKKKGKMKEMMKVSYHLQSMRLQGESLCNLAVVN